MNFGKTQSQNCHIPYSNYNKAELYGADGAVYFALAPEEHCPFLQMDSFGEEIMAAKICRNIISSFL